MAKYEDVKSGIPFVLGMTPVIILSVSNKETEGKNAKQADKIKKGIMKKLEKSITFIEGLKIKSEDQVLMSEFGSQSTSETVQTIQQPVAMVTFNDLNVLSDFKDSLLNKLVCNVRTLDEESAELDKIDEKYFEKKFSDNINVYAAIEDCEFVYEKFEKIQQEEMGSYEEYPEVIIEEDETTEDETAEEEHITLQALEEPRPKPLPLNIESKKEQPVLDDKEHNLSIKKEEHIEEPIIEDFANETQSFSSDQVEEKSIRMAQKILIEKLPEFEIQNTHTKNFSSISAGEEEKKVLVPILEASEINISKKVKENNATLKIEYQTTLNKIFDLVKERIIQENTKIDKETSMTDEASDFYKAVLTLQKYKEDEFSRIQEKSGLFESQKKDDYQKKLKEFIETQVSILEKQYEDENLSVVEKEIVDFRANKEKELELAYEKEYGNIEKQANEARKEQKSLLADKTIQNLNIEINNMIDEYKKSCERLVKATENRINKEYKKLETLIAELSLEHLKSEKIMNDKIEKKVEERSGKYTTMKEKLEVLMEQKEDLETKTKMQNDIVEGYKNLAEMLKNTTEANVERLQMMSDEQAKMIELETNLPIAFGKSSSNRNKSELNWTLIICTALASFSLLTATFLFNKKEAITDEPTTSSSVVQTTSSSIYEVESSHKIGEKIPINVEGKVVEGEIKEINKDGDKTILTVKTPDGKEYVVPV